MKKLVSFSFAILLLASAACTTYTCPTYADAEVDDAKCEQVENNI